MEDGLTVLRLLSRHPSTAAHVSRKLATRFVSDSPPDALVQRMAQRFLATGGDIQAVLEILFYSPEFWSSASYRAKIKTPFELAVSALRGTGAEVSLSPVLLRQMRTLGEVPFGSVPPTGYPDTAEHWVNPGALMDRLNFGLALASNRLPGVRIAFSDRADPTKQAGEWIDNLLGGEVSEGTRRALLGPADPAVTVSPEQVPPKPMTRAERKKEQRRMLGLLLGSPEFQRQ